MIEKLYETLQPTQYKLQLDINTESSEFSGTVTIEANITKPTSVLRLHSKDLTITKAQINEVEVTSFKEGAHDMLGLISDTQLDAGTAKIFIAFEGKITDAMHGMYPCYFEHEGKKKKLIATQFESHHAREVFPCVDEPAAKATFDLTLITNPGETVLANTPLQTSTETDGRLTSIFDTTPRMSSYLLAFVVGEMVSKEAQTKDGVIVRSWASAAQDPDLLDFSVSEAVSYIEYYNDYFGVPYPLQKCDQVALPDFESGAMENWGLITYRETALLSDPNNISLSTQQLVAIVVAHELSHQWFGNLVTMNWWDDLWLNESFASMTEYLAVDSVHPEWMLWEDFYGHDCVSATNRDVYGDVQSVRVAVENPEEIHTLFDPAIVYAKGAKLLKTLYDLLGEDTWRSGLKDYFIQHAYQNTDRDDLWASLSKHSDYDIASLMNTWLEHSGQPILEVTQEGNKVEVSQKRLVLDQTKDDTCWNIPLLAEQAPNLLTKRSETITLGNDTWVKLNSTGIGHYVVNYKEAAHKQWIAEQISDTNTPSTWKIMRLNELTMLAKHGDTSLAEALDTIKQCSTEPRAAVWSQIGSILGSTRMIIEGDEALETKLKTFTLDLVKDQYENIGWEYPHSEPSNTTHLRTSILSLALSTENDDIIQTALRHYRSLENPEDLPAELRGLLMGTAVRFGEKAEFLALLEIYKTTANADYRSDICAALCATRDPDNAELLLTNMLDKDIVRTQDVTRWYIYLLRNHYVRDLAWVWLTSQWEWIVENFGGSKSYDDFARYSASFFNTSEYLQKYQDFFTPKIADPTLKRAITIGIEEIKARSQWKKRDESVVADWLGAYSNPDASR